MAIAAPVNAVAAAVPAGGRSWELVTPRAAVGPLVYDAIAVRDDGDRVVYTSIGAMPGALGGDIISNNLALRTESGWRTEPIDGEYQVFRVDFSTLFGPKLEATNGDLSSFLLTLGAPMLPSGPPEPHIGAYRWSDGSGLTLAGDIGEEGKIDGASADLSRVVFSSAEHVLSTDAGRSEGESIYEWEGPTLRQVDVDTDGSLLSSCGSSVEAGGVSESAERVYFVNPASSGACGNPERIFLREGDGTTIPVSSSRCTGVSCGTPQDASFAGATPSGSAAFFTTTQKLIDADENSKRDLYRFDAGTDALELISPGSLAMEGEVNTTRVLTSSDGSIAYFWASGRILAGGPTGTNLYVAHEGEVTPVGPVDAADPLEISNDGRFAALSTVAQLSEADTDNQIDTYLYDLETEGLTLLSQGPSGGNGEFDATIKAPIEGFGEVPWDLHQISEDGGRVFFGTTESLAPEDHNEALDVYEWDAGRLGLISSGEGTDAAKFTVASGNGGTVVFRTATSLLPSDRDGGDLDLYAARPGSGIPEGQPAPSSCESCVARERGRIARPTLASATARTPHRGRIRLRRVAENACRTAVQRGEVTIVSWVPAPGRVSAVATDRAGGKPRVLLRGVGGAVAAGRLALRLTASAAARRELRIRRRLRVRLVLRQGRQSLHRAIDLGCGA